MTKVEVMEMLATVKDIEVYESKDCIEVTVLDFEGFDEDWDEIERDYDDEAIDKLTTWLEAHADRVEGDFYVYFYFEDCEVCFGYASMDI